MPASGPAARAEPTSGSSISTANHQIRVARRALRRSSRQTSRARGRQRPGVGDPVQLDMRSQPSLLFEYTLQQAAARWVCSRPLCIHVTAVPVIGCVKSGDCSLLPRCGLSLSHRSGRSPTVGADLGEESSVSITSKGSSLPGWHHHVVLTAVAVRLLATRTDAAGRGSRAHVARRASDRHRGVHGAAVRAETVRI